jgi:hypothetical protein
MGNVSYSNHNIPSLPSRGSDLYHNTKSCSLSPRVPRLNSFYIAQNSKFKATQRNSTVRPYKIKKNIMHFQHTMAQSKYSHSKREEWNIVRRNRTKARWKPTGSNIKSCSSMSPTCGARWYDGSSKGLGQPHPYDFPSNSPHGLYPGLAYGLWPPVIGCPHSWHL